METKQQDRVTMYETVVRFLNPTGKGAGLGAIKLIGKWRGELDEVAKEIRTEEERQKTLTTTTTRKRDDVKREAAGQAEVLRNFLLVLSEDNELVALLEAHSALESAKGDDARYLAYLRAVVAGIATIDAKELDEAGYDEKVLTTLKADLKGLTDSTGATRDIQIETSAATDALPELFERGTMILEKKLDRLVNGQRKSETLGELVPEYEKARRIIHTAAKRRAIIHRGATHYDTPVLAIDRLLLPGTDLELGNRSGKGVGLLYYLADTLDARPMKGQGLVVKRNKQVHLGADTIGKLGEVGGRYLLVVQQQMAADGQYWVQG